MKFLVAIIGVLSCTPYQVLTVPVSDREVPESFENTPGTPHYVPQFPENVVLRRISRDDFDEKYSNLNRRTSTSASSGLTSGHVAPAQIDDTSAAFPEINGNNGKSDNDQVNIADVISENFADLSANLESEKRPAETSVSLKATGPRPFAKKSRATSIVSPNIARTVYRLKTPIVTERSSLIYGFSSYETRSIARKAIADNNMVQLEFIADKVVMQRPLMRQILIEICRHPDARVEMAEFWLNRFQFAFNVKDATVESDIKEVLFTAVRGNHFEIISILKFFLGHRFSPLTIYQATMMAIEKDCDETLLKLIEVFHPTPTEIEYFADQYAKRKQKLLEHAKKNHE